MPRLAKSFRRVAVTTAVALAAALPAVSALLTPPASAATLSVRVQGNTLVDGSGASTRLNGVNYSGPEYGCIQGWGIFDGPNDQASVQAMAGWNVKSVRIPLNEDCWLGINGVSSAYGGTNYQNAIVNYVNLLHANGMYAELSLIWGAPGTTKATSQPAAPDADHSPAMWSSLATVFRNDPAVVLSPWGEPQVSWSCLLNGCTNEAGYATAGMQQAVNVMRQAGYHGPIATPCINYANDCNGWLQNRPVDPDNQLIAEAHIYGNNTCGAQNAGKCLTDTVAPVAQQVPVLFGETGETYDDSECTSANMQVILPWADAHNVSYEAWTWDTWGTCLSLVSDYSGTVNTTSPRGAAYAQYVHDHLLAAGVPASPVPGVGLSPTSLAFGNVAVGTTAAARSVTVANTGTAALSFSGIGITGANAGDFAQTNTCPVSPATLAAGASCSVSVTFTPSATGSRTGTLSIADNATGSPQTVALGGSGVILAPAVGLSATSLAFGNQRVGTTSAPRTVTLTNTGSAALTITGMGISGTNPGDFASTTTCPVAPATLAAGAACTLSVTFTPAAIGTRTATLSIADDAGTQAVALSGSGKRRR